MLRVDRKDVLIDAEGEHQRQEEGDGEPEEASQRIHEPAKERSQHVSRYELRLEGGESLGEGPGEEAGGEGTHGVDL